MFQGWASAAWLALAVLVKNLSSILLESIHSSFFRGWGVARLGCLRFGALACLGN